MLFELDFPMSTKYMLNLDEFLDRHYPLLDARILLCCCSSFVLFRTINKEDLLLKWVERTCDFVGRKD